MQPQLQLPNGLCTQLLGNYWDVGFNTFSVVQVLVKRMHIGYSDHYGLLMYFMLCGNECMAKSCSNIQEPHHGSFHFLFHPYILH